MRGQGWRLCSLPRVPLGTGVRAAQRHGHADLHRVQQRTSLHDGWLARKICRGAWGRRFPGMETLGPLRPCLTPSDVSTGAVDRNLFFGRFDGRPPAQSARTCHEPEATFPGARQQGLWTASELWSSGIWCAAREATSRAWMTVEVVVLALGEPLINDGQGGALPLSLPSVCKLSRHSCRKASLDRAIGPAGGRRRVARAEALEQLAVLRARLFFGRACPSDRQP